MNKQINNGGPAYPNEGFNGWGEPCQGMTLRDYFAAKALSGMLADPQVHVGAERSKSLAASCYEVADAMIAAREGGA